MSSIDFIVLGVAVGWFVFNLIGALARWKVVVDPPKHLWLVYPQSFLRLFLNPSQLRIVTILLSLVVLAAMGLIALSWSR